MRKEVEIEDRSGTPQLPLVILASAEDSVCVDDPCLPAEALDEGADPEPTE